MNLKKAVFLDRDGTINVEKDYLVRPEEFEFIPGAPEAIARLKAAGFLVIVVSNQSGVARGYFDVEDVRHLHDHLQQQLALVGTTVDAFYFCPHHPVYGVGEYKVDCDCRKGRPGMLFQAAREHGIDLANSYMVGDKLADVEAGQRAGCRPVLVRTGYGRSEAGKLADRLVPVVNDLPAATDYILAAAKNNPEAGQLFERNTSRMQAILVTGGCGFIGSNFVRLALQELPECRLVNLDKLTYAGNPENLADVAADPRYKFVKGDICDAALVARVFAEEGIDTVVHFAAESHVDRSISGPADFIQTNIVGTFTLLEAARNSWAVRDEESPMNTASRVPRPAFRFLHVSTDEVYGSLGDTGFFTETTPFDPRSPYSASKASSDHLVSAYHHTYGLPTLITNCSNNYGPYHFPEKLIPLIINNALNGKELPVYGDGKNVRDWLYVVDHCQAILTVLQKGKAGETYNIGGNNEKQNLEVVQTVCDLLDERVGLLDGDRPRRSLIRFVKDRPGHDRRYAIDAGKIRRELGWEPSVTFEEGIRRTIDWYLQNPQWIASVLDGSYQEYYEKMYGGR